MPSTSRKQEIAMQIAAAGKSNIGIPQKVGKEFAAADRRKKMSGGKKNASQGMKGMAYRNKMDPKKKGSQMKGYGDGSNPGYKHRANKPSYSTGGMSAAVGSNAEYRHDDVKQSRNPQTRGSTKTGYATGYGSRNKQTPDNYYVQDGASKMQKCMVEKMRTRKSPGSVSSSAFRGGYPHNPHRGGY